MQLVFDTGLETPLFQAEEAKNYELKSIELIS